MKNRILIYAFLAASAFMLLLTGVLSRLPVVDDDRFALHDALMLFLVPGLLLRWLVSNHDRLFVSFWWVIAANLLFYWSLAYLLIVWRERIKRREK
jgi:hypothetical protein